MTLSEDALAQEARGYYEPLKASAMQLDMDTLREWNSMYMMDGEEYSNQAIGAEALFGPPSQSMRPGFNDLSHLVPGKGEQRNQKACGDCFVWAATAAMEVARSNHDQASPGDRLSVQFFNSCYESPPFSSSIAYHRPPCCGGALEEFARWYNYSPKFAVPWDSAPFVDDTLECSPDIYTNKDCSSILNVAATNPQYPIAHIGIKRIETGYFDERVDTNTAIERIKNSINDNRPVIFTIVMGGQGQYNKFVDWWNGSIDSDIWNTDDYVGIVDPKVNAHTMLIVGYNDTDVADLSRNYWIVLNSFGEGLSTNHPDGLFRMKMYMKYRVKVEDEPARLFRTLDVQFSDRLPSKSPLISSYSGRNAI